MRIKLPARPNLSQLKNQARELKRSVDAGNVSQWVRLSEHLPGYHSGDTLSLSDAQLVIAREYGYPSWPKLKHAVERLNAGNDPGRSGAGNDTVHITCGDAQSHTLFECNIPGLRLPWRDLFNMGPLPLTNDFISFNRTRMGFLKRWSRLPGLPDPEKAAVAEVNKLRYTLEAERIIFWMWPLLTHQLTLICLLDWYAANGFRGEIFLIDSGRFPRQYDGDAMLALYQDLQPVTEKQVAVARDTWAAVRQNTPENLLDFVKTGQEDLPHLREAMLRFLEELPGAFNGLSRTEQAILLALRSGMQPRGEVYRSVYNQETYPFVGDWGMWELMSQLITADFPLIETSDGKAFIFEPAGKYNPGQQFALTELGEKVCGGQEDHIVRNGIDRWWGGVHLIRDNLWRFDRDAMKLYFGSK